MLANETRKQLREQLNIMKYWNSLLEQTPASPIARAVSGQPKHDEQQDIWSGSTWGRRIPWWLFVTRPARAFFAMPMAKAVCLRS